MRDNVSIADIVWFRTLWSAFYKKICALVSIKLISLVHYIGTLI